MPFDPERPTDATLPMQDAPAPGEQVGTDGDDVLSALAGNGPSVTVTSGGGVDEIQVSLVDQRAVITDFDVDEGGESSFDRLLVASVPNPDTPDEQPFFVASPDEFAMLAQLVLDRDGAVAIEDDDLVLSFDSPVDGASSLTLLGVVPDLQPGLDAALADAQPDPVPEAAGGEVVGTDGDDALSASAADGAAAIVTSGGGVDNIAVSLSGRNTVITDFDVDEGGESSFDILTVVSLPNPDVPGEDPFTIATVDGFLAFVETVLDRGGAVSAEDGDLAVSFQDRSAEQGGSLILEGVVPALEPGLSEILSAAAIEPGREPFDPRTNVEGGDGDDVVDTFQDGTDGFITTGGGRDQIRLDLEDTAQSIVFTDFDIDEGGEGSFDVIDVFGFPDPDDSAADPFFVADVDDFAAFVETAIGVGGSASAEGDDVTVAFFDDVLTFEGLLPDLDGALDPFLA